LFSILSDKKLNLNSLPNRPKRKKQPPARFCDPKQIAKKSKVEVDSSKETEVDLSKETEVDLSKEKEVTLSKEKEVFLSKEKEVDSFQKKRNLKRHIGEVHERKKPFVEKKKIDQKSMTSSPNEDETPNAGMILHKHSNLLSL
jgi:hypothetical protein